MMMATALAPDFASTGATAKISLREGSAAL
jgi:hypothetical protein